MKRNILVLISVICIILSGCVKETKKSEDATLKKLILTNVSGTAILLNESFLPNRTSYSALVDYKVNKIKITAEASDEKATLLGLGTFDINGESQIFSVIVKAEKGNSIKYNIEIKKGEAEVSAIRFVVTNAAMRVGRKFALKTEIEMEDAAATAGAVTYRSLNTSVASVSVDGVVYGISQGNAVIEAKAREKTTTAVITVVADFPDEIYIDRSANYSYTKSQFPLGGNIPGPADWTRANIMQYIQIHPEQD